MRRTVLWVAAFLIGTGLASNAGAASITFSGGVLTIPGTSTTGTSFTYNGTLTQSDTIAFTQTGNPCLQSGNTYCTNGAGVVTVAGSTPVGGASSFAGPTGIIPAGTWTFGSLIMIISGVGAVQVFPTNAANGLGSPSPPTNLTLQPTTLASLGFGSFSVSNPTITFIVADTGFLDNSGQFVLIQTATAVPTLSKWGLVGLGLAVGLLGLIFLRRLAG